MSINDKIILGFDDNDMCDGICTQKGHSDHTYNYTCPLTQSEQTGFIRQQININTIKHSVMIQYDRFGRLGNYLFPLALLVICNKQFCDYFKNDNIKMYTSWHCTYESDQQSGVQNAYNFPSNKLLKIYSKIDCKHFLPSNEVICNIDATVVYKTQLVYKLNGETIKFCDFVVYKATNKERYVFFISMEDRRSYLILKRWIQEKGLNMFDENNIDFTKDISKHIHDKILADYRSDESQKIIGFQLGTSRNGYMDYNFMIDHKKILMNDLFVNYDDTKKTRVFRSH